MTSKTYRTAQGKTVDLGQLILQNETVRAVGNMNVNARGDRLDSSNRVIDSKNQQIQRQHQQQIASNVSDQPVHTSNIHARQAKKSVEQAAAPAPANSNLEDAPASVDTNLEDTPAPVETVAPSGGGLAAAIARSRTVVQEKEKTPREVKQFKPGVNKI
jgi:hypothetical protein